ncbi:hypothetical protein [Bdellovibrio sp. ZAP7]|uniref:hypothetical protein n=1 Tax=Bdellovibrio sp. ZAP7 TaxID=2231053 RepID=UPI001AEF994D|nr:hypothetical protein [Bdellovibrio sp. ZAP7]
MVKLHKGELWRPDSFKQRVDEVTVKVASGIGWVTYKCSSDAIYREGEVLKFDEKEPLVEALTEELSLEIEFKKKALNFWRSK